MLGDFNGVKGDEKYDQFVVDRYGYIKIIKLIFDTFKSSPKYSLLGLTRTTYPVYTITEDYANILYVALDEYDDTDHGIKSRNLEIVEQVYNEKINSVFPLFKYIGLMNLLVIIGLLIQTNYKKVLIALPMLVYNFGTMMLLYMHFDSIRYFFYTFVVTPIILVILFRKNNKYEKVKGMYC